MLLVHRWCVLATVLLTLSGGLLKAQEDIAPIPMTDPLRPLRVQQRDTWQEIYKAQREEKNPLAALSAAWALFHEFDVAYFALLEDDGAQLLKAYETDTKKFIEDLAPLAKEDKLAQLAILELQALLDDFEANRLQTARPENLPGESPEMKRWNDQFASFQLSRAVGLQERGKLVLTLYRSGDIDVSRLCIVLLERQIAERVLLEHNEMTAGEKMAAEFAARRKSLLEKQRREWQQLEKLLPDTDARAPQVPLGEQVCAIQLLSIDLLEARLAASRATEVDRKGADEKVASIVQKLLTAYRDLHRASARQHGEGRLSAEALARLHDFRMYTTIWSDPTAITADVAADSIEVAAMWEKLSTELQKTNADSPEARIALAKKLETEIIRQERVAVTTEPAATTQPPPPSQSGR